MHARLDAGRAQILTRRGNDWTNKYPAVAKAVGGLPARNADIDGVLCGVLPDGRTAFNLIQNATDTGQGSLVFFLFDLLFLDAENLMALPLVERKTRLASLLAGAPDSLRYNDHQIEYGPELHASRLLRLARNDYKSKLARSRQLVSAQHIRFTRKHGKSCRSLRINGSRP